MPKLYTGEAFHKWNEVEAEVEARTGKNIRDWAGRNDSDDASTPYWDFWHKVLKFYNVHNGAVITINFDDMAKYFEEAEPENAKWIREICNEFIAVLGESGEEGHSIKVEW